MILKLGDKAATFDLGAGALIDGMLWGQAARLYDASPKGSALELRAALVCLGLCVEELSPLTMRLAATCGYDVGRLGGALWTVFERGGMAPEKAVEAFAGALAASAKPVEAQPRAPAAQAPMAASEQDDPYPGLTQEGETWPAFNLRTASDRSMVVANLREEWRAAGEAFEAGRIVAWVSEVGASLGFRWEPPGEG